MDLYEELYEKIKKLYKKHKGITAQAISGRLIRVKKYRSISLAKIKKILIDIEIDDDLGLLDEKPKILIDNSNQTQPNWHELFPDLEEIDLKIIDFLYINHNKSYPMVGIFNRITQTGEPEYSNPRVNALVKKKILKKVTEGNQEKYQYSGIDFLTQLIPEKISNSPEEDPNDIAPIEPISQKYPMVVCTKCGFVQPYRGKTTGRKHKICPLKKGGCGEHFDIKPHEQTKLQEAIPKKPWVDLNLKLGKTDKKIIDLLENKGTPCHLTQRQITEKYSAIYGKIHLSTISRHMNKLVDMKIVERIDLAIKVYQLNYSYLQSVTRVPLKEIQEDDGKENFLSTHHFRSGIPILQGYKSIDFAVLQTLPEVKNIYLQPMGPGGKSYIKYHFEIQDLKFRITSQNIFFNTIGAGKTGDEAIANIHEKTEKLKIFFSQHLPLQLGNPTYFAIDDEIHYVNHRGTPEEIQLFKEVLEDKSHKGTIETTNQAFAESMVNVHLQVQYLTEQVHNLSQSPAPQPIQPINHSLETKIDKIEQNIGKLTDQMTILTDVLVKALPQPQSIQQPFQKPSSISTSYI